LSVGVWQLVVILVIVVLIFGLGKLPKSAADLAEGIKAFKRNMKDEDQPVAPAEPEPRDPTLITAEKIAADRDRPTV
jgi:sec-independent protein translocase protein TatA